MHDKTEPRSLQIIKNLPFPNLTEFEKEMLALGVKYGLVKPEELVKSAREALKIVVDNTQRKDGSNADE